MSVDKWIQVLLHIKDDLTLKCSYKTFKIMPKDTKVNRFILMTNVKCISCDMQKYFLNTVYMKINIYRQKTLFLYVILNMA